MLLSDLVIFVALRTACANLKHIVRVAKQPQSEKVQDFFQDPGNTRRISKGIQSITDDKAAPLPCNDDIGFLNNLNYYFGRFETTKSIPVKKSTPHPDELPLSLATADVKRSLRRVNTRKAAGPDKIPGQRLKERADQLTGALPDIFNISLDHHASSHPQSSRSQESNIHSPQ